jgi:predicted transcriptional regulator
MVAKTKQSHPTPVHPTRASITFPPEIYSTLEAIARSKKVSVAWVVRDAIDKYLAQEQSPTR